MSVDEGSPVDVFTLSVEVPWRCFFAGGVLVHKKSVDAGADDADGTLVERGDTGLCHASALAPDPETGALFALGHTDGVAALFTIDREDGAATVVAALPSSRASGVGGLAIGPACALYVTSTDGLLRIDKATGAVEVVREMSTTLASMTWDAPTRTFIGFDWFEGGGTFVRFAPDGGDVVLLGPTLDSEHRGVTKVPTD